MPARHFVVCALFVILAGCSDPRKEVEKKITPGEARELRIAAAQLYKEARAKRAPEFLPLKQSKWPERFKKLKPLRVGVYRDGVALALHGNASTEEGLHILPVAMDLAPTRGRITYEKLQDGVYWYKLGK